MKQRVFAWILALILALTPVLALAEGDEPESTALTEPSSSPSEEPTAPPSTEPTAPPTEQPTAAPETPEPTGESTDPLKIDTYWKYPGMEKSYAAGYVPTVTDTSVKIVMPLIGKTQGDTIRVVPVFPDDGPFEPGNYQFDVREKSYNVRHSTDKTGTMKAYLITFSVPLKNPHYKGTYTITFQTSYKTPSGDATEQTFSMQVSIKNGKNQSTGGGGNYQPSVKKPVLLIETGTVTPTDTEGDAKVALKVSIVNRGQLEARNIHIVPATEDPDLQLLSDLNGVFLVELPVDETTETSFEFRVLRHALEGDHLMQVNIAYEDKYGNTFNEAGSYRVHVSQPVELEHDPIKLPETLTSGDTFPQIIYVYNPSCATAYNVRGVLNVEGLICSSAYLGNIPPQGSAEKELSVFVTTLPNSTKYGDTRGSFEVHYENEAGEELMIYQDLKSTIQEPVQITDEEKVKQEQEQKEQQTLSQWWISLLVAIAVIIILIAVILIARFARMMRMK